MAPGALNLCLMTPAEISFQENETMREQAQARTDLTVCAILSTLDTDVRLAKRAFETAKNAGLSHAACTLASTSAVVAVNSRVPNHVCDIFYKVSGLTGGVTEEEARITSHRNSCN